jgi:two-component sensor histidine kinase
MWDFFTHLFDAGEFTPRRFCGNWPAELVWLHIGADLLIWLAYLAIPAVLLYFAWRRRDVPVHGIFWLFGAFILSCGFAHLVEAVMFYEPMYRLSALAKIITALASWATVIGLVTLVPRALALRSPSDLDREIEERKQAEADLRRTHGELEVRMDAHTEELSRANQAKEVLLKEIHHRVKNNLQVISSLLSLQARTLHDDTTIAMLQESQLRVQSMALIHAKLYQSQDFTRVHFAEYVRSLTTELFRAYRVNTGAIRLHTRVEDVFLTVDLAIPCGLILNEMLSNCLKHAFPGDRRGEIHITFGLQQHDYVLSVADDGVGFPAEVDFQTTRSLGLRLIRTLVSQLDGVMKLDGSPGTHMVLRFPAVI